jgi:hypothetical protein
MTICVTVFQEKNGIPADARSASSYQKRSEWGKKGDKKKSRVLRCKELCASPAWGPSAI